MGDGKESTLVSKDKRDGVLTDLVTSETRTTTYIYNSGGLFETVDGPRADVNDITTYGYDSASNINTITNALNHVGTLENYDARGHYIT